MRTPTNQVLLSMAVADAMTLVFSVPWYFYNGLIEFACPIIIITLLIT